MTKESRKAHYNEMVNDWTYEHKIEFSKKRIHEFVKMVGEMKEDKSLIQDLNEKELDYRNHKGWDKEKERLREAYRKAKSKVEHANNEIIVAFSGGRDSSVLLHLVRTLYPNIKGVFSNTGVEYLEIVDLVRTYDNIEELPPIKSQHQSVKEQGFPILSKKLANTIKKVYRSKSKSKTLIQALGIEEGSIFDIPKRYIHFLDERITNWGKEDGYMISAYCCEHLKGKLKNDKRPSFVGSRATESIRRKGYWIRNGCNFVNDKYALSTPLSIWTDEDVQRYIDENNIKLPSMYDEGVKSTGCKNCGFGASFDESNGYNRWEILKQKEPKFYNGSLWIWGFAKPLADAGIVIPSDDRYMSLYNERKKIIDEWYNNYDVNMSQVIKQIEKRTKITFTKEEKQTIITNNRPKYNTRG